MFILEGGQRQGRGTGAGGWSLVCYGVAPDTVTIACRGQLRQYGSLGSARMPGIAGDSEYAEEVGCGPRCQR